MVNQSPVLRFRLRNKNSPLAENQKKSFSSSFSGRSLGFVGLVCPLAHWAYLPKHTHTQSCSFLLTLSSNDRSSVEHFWAECDEQWQVCSENDAGRGWNPIYTALLRSAVYSAELKSQSVTLSRDKVMACVGDSRGFRVEPWSICAEISKRSLKVLCYFRLQKVTSLNMLQVLSGILADYKFPTRIKKPPWFEAAEAAPPTVLSPDGTEASSLSFAALSPTPRAQLIQSLDEMHCGPRWRFYVETDH